jgi:hypothetical protein
MPTYRVQRDDDVQILEEGKLRRKLRSKDLTGLELVLREGDETWVPLCETELFREEVPFRGHPRDAARRRDVQGFVGHLSGWVITAGVMAALGSWFPFWLWIWAVFLAMHGAKVAPSAVALLGSGQLFEPGGPPRPARLPEPRAGRIEPGPGGRAPLAAKADRIRALLRERTGDEAERLARELEALVAALQEIARRRADLEAQLSPDELRGLKSARDEATRRLESADNGQDRELFERELEAIDQRYEAVRHAQRTLARLQSQERVVEHQLEQLRLDLSQAKAREVAVPDLAERVEAIRLEAGRRRRDRRGPRREPPPPVSGSSQSPSAVPLPPRSWSTLAARVHDPSRASRWNVARRRSPPGNKSSTSRSKNSRSRSGRRRAKSCSRSARSFVRW